MKYDGKTDFNAFLVKFELCGEAYFWSEQDKMLYLVEILEDEALRFFSRQSEEIRRSYELSKQQLIRMFGKHETQPTLRAELAAIRQKEDEDLEKYGQRVMHLSYRAFADFPPINFESEEKDHIDSLLSIGVIQPSSSDWASPPVLVRKKDGKVRWCIDYRALNNVTVKDAYPLPNISECLDSLGDAKFFSTLDMSSGYYQIEIAEEDRAKTAFLTKYGLFEHSRMPFGLCNAPATFQRAMSLVLRGLTWNEVLAYLDDIILVGRSFEDHLQTLIKVFQRFRQHNLKLKAKKCHLFQRKVVFLGKLVSDQGISANPENVASVLKWPAPTTVKEVQQFLGVINYHRAHIKKFSEISRPLFAIIKKDADFEWETDQKVAFETLKTALTSSPVLAFPRINDEPFILDTDASEAAIGAELLQVQDGEERVISYGSYALTPSQRNYCVTRKELIAIVRFTRQFRHYLLGQRFYVRTDHSSLTWLLSFKNPSGLLARWLEELSQYDMVIQYRKGRTHSNADGQSRIPDTVPFCKFYVSDCKPSELPCGGCHFCLKAHKEWSRFEEDVDDVVPLVVRQISQVGNRATSVPSSTESAVESNDIISSLFNLQ